MQAVYPLPYLDRNPAAICSVASTRWASTRHQWGANCNKCNAKLDTYAHHGSVHVITEQFFSSNSSVTSVMQKRFPSAVVYYY